MKRKGISVILCLMTLSLSNCYGQKSKKAESKLSKQTNEHMEENKVKKSNEEWKQVLSPEVYRVARLKGTERPFTSAFEHSKEIGTYYCAACGNALFKSDTKFDSGCGWPSFYEPISKHSIIYEKDVSLGMVRTEVMCGKCDAHLGHVFNDGPPPTGLRYCINGVVLDFEKAKAAEKSYDSRKNDTE